MRLLINEDGIPFESHETGKLREALDLLGDDDRIEYRNQNAAAIAQNDAFKFLVVSGPGTGKSHLFLEKVYHWFQKNPYASIIVTSFVRKLVVDLQSDIENDERLTREQKGKITVCTLHKLARSIVEKNHGTVEWKFRPHFRVIGQFWKDVVWRDVLGFYSDIDPGIFTWKKFEGQLHNAAFEELDEWKALKETYFGLCDFYNAAGFSDLILRATKAVVENPALNEFDYFIVDEYQDFNFAEDALIKQLANIPNGLFLVGDDEQVLYEQLKAGKSELIRNLYKNTEYAKGMLPFCARSSYYITKTADHFIQTCREGDSIEKIYLPLETSQDRPRVQVVACASPPTAVDSLKNSLPITKQRLMSARANWRLGRKKMHTC
jgi:superfamily I DNA/RNA helicase